MATGKAEDIPAPLKKTRRRFERWRQTGPGKSRIPERLWDAAVMMAQKYGLARTASVLRLDYNRLKKRLGQNAGESSATLPGAAKTTFVEFPAAVRPATAECVVELEDGGGSKMRIHLKGAEAPDLAALSRNFFRGE
jgi:hypothetical protein